MGLGVGNLERAACAAAVLFGASCLNAQEPAAPTVFVDVAVVDLERDSLLEHQAVIIEGSTIGWIGPAADLDLPDNALMIDGAGRYLMPGLADMHVHMDRTDVSLFLANGITTVREMNGADWHLALRDSIADGLTVGPRMFVTSPLLAGEAQQWRHELIETPEAATERAQRLRDSGYDYIKVYDGLKAPVYAAFDEASGLLGLPLVGHIPAEVGLDGALASSQIEITHVEQIVYATVGHDFDAARIPGIAAQIAESGKWVSPTLASQKALSLARTTAYNERLAGAEMRFVSSDLMGWWRSLAASEGSARRPNQRSDQFYAFQRDLTLALFEAGVPLVVGTDTPNPLLVPGFSIHLELEALIGAGIPAIDVLRAATIGAAQFAGDADRGTVRVGAVADLLLLSANPLDDLATLRSPEGVMTAGTWLDRASLDQLLDERSIGN